MSSAISIRSCACWFLASMLGSAAPPLAAESNAAIAITIDSLSPSAWSTGAGSLALTIAGSGFVAPVVAPPALGSVVRLTTPTGPATLHALPTTFISPTKLMAQLPADGTTRATLARLAMLAQLPESSITALLNLTGGVFCSFADVTPCPGNAGGVATDTTGIAGDWRYIEALYRSGLAQNCSSANDAVRRFCPSQQFAVLGTPGTYPIDVAHIVAGPLPATTVSNSVSFVLLELTPGLPVPALAPALLLALGTGLLATGLHARRQRPGSRLRSRESSCDG